MIKGVAHVSFSVTELDRTIDFYSKVLGLRLISRGQVKENTLGRALFGAKWGVAPEDAEIDFAIIKAGNVHVEFIEYIKPKAEAYHKNPSIAGSAHLAFHVENIEEFRKRLEKAGVDFHSPINDLARDGKVEWRWCYFRDPDGIVVELVQKGSS